MEWLNYHHLRYFWMVAKEGSLRKAAERLAVSQPSISAQLHLLETALGAPLFRRSGRRLVLTETGQMVFGYAEEIFAIGQDLLDAVQDRPGHGALRCQIGVADSVPKLVASRILRPAFHLSQPLHMTCREGSAQTLLLELAAYRLDLVLTDEPASRNTHVQTFSHLLGTCGSVVCGTPKLAARLCREFPRSLHQAPALLPVETTPLRMVLEKWFLRLGIRPLVVAEFEDPAFMMAMAAEGHGFVAAPSVVLRETLQQYGLKTIGQAEQCAQQYYAISAERRLNHPAVIAITEHSRTDLFPPGDRRQTP
jgi:LysR family transcriptional activator of nhaA